ncbi:nucleolar complex protein 2 [Strigomonas culicis]|uniref:Nucleolar complex protein 2 n=1 Tax=Strigomonas culicis TaxID=28005 RepID=S9U8X9_9TRYP|nr:nucleolar complex protein 2 [Strigomonas culicis]|eukprot:EPY27202.1 nucleolar complex protein 2 [Strigomonas culicis]
MPKEKKSFKKYAKKHLASVIETRRKTAKSKKEKTERVQRKKVREAKEAAKEEQEHVDQLERLKDTDPEFYSYLEEEDPTLLQFGKDDMDIVEGEEGSDEETDVEGSGEDAEQGEGEREAEDTADPRSRISESDLQKLVAAGKPEACVDVFIAAVRELGYPLKEGPRPSTTRKFEEPSLVKQSLIQIGQHISRSVSSFISSKGSMSLLSTRIMVKRFILATVAVIGQGNVDAALTTGLLQSLAAFVPVLHYMKGITRAVLRAALHLCTVPEEAVRVAAYMVVRAVATRATGTRSMYQSTAFKGIFLAMVRTAHLYNIHNQTVVAFLINCVVDLYGTDLEAAYQHAFVYLRQLAIYLRAALQQQTQANVRAVVNWQYLNALRTWGAVVSTYSDPAQLGPLIHPVVQIATTLMDLFSSPRMFPMHLQIIEVLNHIASRTNGVYIPVAPYILRILTSPSVALSNAPSGAASTEPVELQFTLRVKKSQARSNAYHRELWENALYLLTEHLATHSHVVGFPEAFWAVDSTLKKLRADVKVPKIHSQIANILRHVEANARRIAARRDQLDFGPCDLTATKQFEDEQRQQGNSLVTFYQGLRQQRVGKFTAKQKNLQEGRVTLESALQGKRKAKKGTKRGRDE